jgi:CRP-like cAMP-binding protein
MKPRTYAPGEIIIQEGETNRDLFVLNEGIVEISTKEENGKYVLSEIEPPQIFGELSFLTGEPRTATAKTKTKAEVLIFEYEFLQNQIRNLPEWIKPVLNALINRNKACDKKIVELKQEVLTLKTTSTIPEAGPSHGIAEQL